METQKILSNIDTSKCTIGNLLYMNGEFYTYSDKGLFKIVDAQPVASGNTGNKEIEINFRCTI